MSFGSLVGLFGICVTFGWSIGNIGNVHGETELEVIYTMEDTGYAYYLSYIDPGLYIYGNDFYNAAFFTSGEGVIMVDAPPFLASHIVSIVENVTDEAIAYVVYTHHHLDHIGGATAFADVDDVIYICHEEAAAKIKEGGVVPECDVVIETGDLSDNSTDIYTDDDSGSAQLSGLKLGLAGLTGLTTAALASRHDNTIGGVVLAGAFAVLYFDGLTPVYGSDDMISTLESSGLFTIGTQSIAFDYWGAVHSDGNLFVYSSQHEFLMVVDLVYPGFIPFKYLGFAEDVSKYISGHSYALDNYDFTWYVGGHVNSVGTNNDVVINKAFVEDLYSAASQAYGVVDFADGYTQEFSNPWEILNYYQTSVAEACVDILETQYNGTEWYTTFTGIDVYIQDHCYWAAQDIYINI